MGGGDYGCDSTSENGNNDKFDSSDPRTCENVVLLLSNYIASFVQCGAGRDIISGRSV